MHKADIKQSIEFKSPWLGSPYLFILSLSLMSTGINEDPSTFVLNFDGQSVTVLRHIGHSTNIADIENLFDKDEDTLLSVFNDSISKLETDGTGECTRWIFVNLIKSFLAITDCCDIIAPFIALSVNPDGFLPTIDD
jgi:hypothetical protein